MINYLSKEQAMAVIMNEYGCSRAQSYRYVSDAMSVLAILCQSKEAEKYLLGRIDSFQQRSIKIKMKLLT
jgi:hypothetical protein